MTDPGAPRHPTAFIESWNAEGERLARHGPASMIDRYYAFVYAPIDVLLEGDDDLHLVIHGEQSSGVATERVPVFLVQVIRLRGAADDNVLARVRLRRPSNIDIQPGKPEFADVERAFGTPFESNDLWGALERINAIPAGLRGDRVAGAIDPGSVPPLDDRDRIPGPICRMDTQIEAGISVCFCTIVTCWP